MQICNNQELVSNSLSTLGASGRCLLRLQFLESDLTLEQAISIAAEEKDAKDVSLNLPTSQQEEPVTTTASKSESTLVDNAEAGGGKKRPLNEIPSTETAASAGDEAAKSVSLDSTAIQQKALSSTEQYESMLVDRVDTEGGMKLLRTEIPSKETVSLHFCGVRVGKGCGEWSGAVRVELGLVCVCVCVCVCVLNFEC